MFSFKNDYSEGAHPRLLEAILMSNDTQEDGYGLDNYTLKAIQAIQSHLSSPSSSIYLLSGGTQTNLLAISSFLRPHEAVVAPQTGHIAVHETGAIEATGHKILTVPSTNGRLTPEQIESIFDEHSDEHAVKPKMVYISQPTELGTCYSNKELLALYTYCQKRHLYLYIDGARLGSAMAASEGELTLEFMCQVCDAFFIGGTKNGALLGEALIINRPSLAEDFRFLIKQKGALLAKGRLLGIQFYEFFKEKNLDETLYMSLARHANDMADLLRDGLTSMGVDFFIETTTNQVFPIFKEAALQALLEEFSFYRWVILDEKKSALRLVTSWATPPEAVEAFLLKAKELT